MEKLHSDMLEMILTQPIKRLNERQTKFLIYQVRTKKKLFCLTKFIFAFLGSCCSEIFT